MMKEAPGGEAVKQQTASAFICAIRCSFSARRRRRRDDVPQGEREGDQTHSQNKE